MLECSVLNPPSSLRVLVVTESFLPQVNGVTNSVCRALEHLKTRGHTSAVIAPTGPDNYAGAAVHRVGGVGLPGYEGFTVGLATCRRLLTIMEDFRPHVVHIASPFVLGYTAVRAANSLGIPVVSIYQTDMVGFAFRYRMKAARRVIEQRLRRIHQRSDLTLVPSTASFEQLGHLGIPRLRFWPRGVDTNRFTPGKRNENLRHRLSDFPANTTHRRDVLVGYVGRLAKEKILHHLQALHQIPGVRLILVGEGPDEQRLRQLLPEATFLGPKYGEDLAQTMACLDIFVHPGTDETFCQAVQEALAAGVPAVGPAAGGLKDRITHGVNGLNYAPGDRAGLREAVATLVSDARLRRRMAEAARRGVQDRPWGAINDLLIEHYRETLSVDPDARRNDQDRRKGLHGLGV